MERQIYEGLCRSKHSLLRTEFAWGGDLNLQSQDPKSGALNITRGCSGGAMVLGKLPIPGCSANLDDSRTRASALAVGAGCLDIFFLSAIISLLSPSSWERTHNRLKYCLKELLNPTNQQTEYNHLTTQTSLSPL